MGRVAEKTSGHKASHPRLFTSCQSFHCSIPRSFPLLRSERSAGVPGVRKPSYCLSSPMNMLCNLGYDFYTLCIGFLICKTKGMAWWSLRPLCPALLLCHFELDESTQEARPGFSVGDSCAVLDLPSSVFWNLGTGPEKEENGAIPALMASLTDGVIISSHIIL